MPNHPSCPLLSCLKVSCLSWSPHFNNVHKPSYVASLQQSAGGPLDLMAMLNVFLTGQPRFFPMSFHGSIRLSFLERIV